MIDPGTPEWLRTITPSKVASVLAVSRWQSAYGLWHEMKGLVDPEPHKAIFDTGHAFELALAYLWRLENPDWRLSPKGVQLASTNMGFPALATLDRRASLRGPASAKYRRVVEFKTARNLEDWGDDFSDEAPGDYLVQVLFQMMVSGWTHHPGHLVVMGPFLRHHTYLVHYDAQIANDVAQQCKDFYLSLQRNTVPPLDNTVHTYRCLKALHPLIERDRIVQVDPGLIEGYRRAEARKQAADAEAQGYKNRLADVMGNAQRAAVRVDDATTVNVALRKPHNKGGVAMMIDTKKALTKEDSQS